MEWRDDDWVLIDESNSLPSEWCYFGSSYDSSRNVICLYGGFSDSSIDELWEWDGNFWHQVLKTSIWPPTCGSPGMIYNPDIQKNVVLLNDNGQMEVWNWDGVVWEEQVSGSPRPPVRFDMEIAYDPDRMRLVMFGGMGNRNDTWEWDGVQWYEMNPLHKPSGRMGHTLTWDENSHRIMLFGGTNDGGERNGETWFYDGMDWTYVPPDPVLPSRCQ